MNRPHSNERTTYADWKTCVDAAGLSDVHPTGIQRRESDAAYVERSYGSSCKEGLMITVEYPPGSSDPIHRHNAHAFVYVLRLKRDAGTGRKGSDTGTWSDLCDFAVKLRRLRL